MSTGSKISRRAFFRRTLAAGGVTLLVYANGRYRITFANAGAVVYKMRILHTNDHHARIEPANVTLQSSPSVTRNFGGVARRKTLLDDLIAAAAPDENVFLLDAGDIFQGTLYFNLYNGAADKSFYNQIGYDAVAVGNHEFDKGQTVLRDFLLGKVTDPYPNPAANFPMVSANIVVDPTAELAAALAPTDIAVPGKLGKRLIITRGGKKVGIFGLTPTDTGILSNPGAGVTFAQNIIPIAQAQVDALKGDGADYIIGLTHVGYDVDQQLAAGVRGINVIVGGHSHTPLLPDVNPPSPVGVTSQGPYPTIVKDPDNKDVIITTDWEWGKWLGDITVGFDENGVVSVISGVIHPVWAEVVPPSRTLLPGEEAPITPNATFQTEIDTIWKPGVTDLEKTEIGTTSVFLDGERPNVRNFETNLGDLIADALLEKTKSAGASIAITNGGGIRASIPGPTAPAATDPVTVGEVLTVLPFGNTIALVTLTGAQIIEALENGVSQVNLTTPSSSAGRFPQVAGLRFVWDPLRPVGGRIVQVWVQETTSAGQSGNAINAYVPINLTATYRVATNNFMLTGGDGYSVFTEGTGQIDTGFIMADEVSNYITANSPVDPATEGRITRVSAYYPFVAYQSTTQTVTSTLMLR